MTANTFHLVLFCAAEWCASWAAPTCWPPPTPPTRLPPPQPQWRSWRRRCWAAYRSCSASAAAWVSVLDAITVPGAACRGCFAPAPAEQVPWRAFHCCHDAASAIFLTLACCTTRPSRPAGSEGGGVKPDWAHVYLSVLSVLPLHLPRDEGRVAAALRAAAAAITARHAAQLRRAAVAQWEVRLRVPDKSGAWRVVVAAPTGHEAGEECVEVYREAVGQDARIVYSSRDNIGGGWSGGWWFVLLGTRSRVRLRLEPAGLMTSGLCACLALHSPAVRPIWQACYCAHAAGSSAPLSPSCLLLSRRRQVRPQRRRARAGALPAAGAAAAKAAGCPPPQDHLLLRLPRRV